MICCDKTMAFVMTHSVAVCSLGMWKDTNIISYYDVYQVD